MGSQRCAAVVAMLLACCFIPGQPGDAQTTEAYYLVGGEKVPLTPSHTFSAFKLKPGTSKEGAAVFKSSVAEAGIGTAVQHPLLEKRGIILVRIAPNVGPSTVQRGVGSLVARSEVEAEHPVYTVRGVDQVLVNEFVVQFRDGTDPAAIEGSLAEKGATVLRKPEKIANRYVVTFPGKTPREALDAANAYAADAKVRFVEPSFVVIFPARPVPKKEGAEPAAPPPGPSAKQPGETATPLDPLYPFQWYLHNSNDADIDAPRAWDVTKGAPSVIVAIVDEGVDVQHPDLISKIITPYDATDGDNDQQPNPADGHGTSCAGIAAAITGNVKGVAGIGWETRIMPVRIAQGAPGGGWATTYEAIEDGIRTAVDRGAQVLSCSWGGGSSNLVNEAIDYAISRNRVMVFAAGNNAGPISWPANLSASKDIIAVGATNQKDEFKTPTSSDGETWWGSNFGAQMSVVAPGVGMYTTDIHGDDGYAAGDYVANFNGTSSATPLVAGVASLLLAQNPTWTPAQVRARLQQTADDLGPSGFDNQFGHGRVNACKAVGGQPCDPPPGPCSSIAPRPTSGGQSLLNVLLILSAALLLLVPLFRKPQPLAR